MSSLIAGAAMADYEFASDFGEQGVGPGMFEALGQISMHNDGRLLITDEQLDRAQLCDYEGNCTILGGNNPPSFMTPFGIDDDSQGRIIVQEFIGNKLNICEPDVSGDCAIMFGTQGSALGQVDLPRGIVVDDQDLIIIADRNNHRIQKCTTGWQCTSFGGFGNFPQDVGGFFWNPSGVALDSMGNIIVADTENDRIQVCDYDGMCTAFGEFGDEPGKFNEPQDVAVDWAGRIVVMDWGNRRLQLCDYVGVCSIIDISGSGSDESGLARLVSTDNLGNIFVYNGLNYRVQIFHDSDFGAPQFVINAGMNDAWVSADAPFQGFFFTVFPKLSLFFLSWFTFDSTLPIGDDTAVFGAGDQRWVTGAGIFSGNSVTINIELTSGGIFNGSDPLAAQMPSYGTITIVFNNCNEAVLTYNFPSLGLSGEMTLTRVVPSNVPLCESLSSP